MNTQKPTTARTALCFELPHAAEAPEWVSVLPAGPRIVGRDGRTWTADAASIIATTMARGADLPFDIEHATELKAPNGDPAPAMGWAKEYRVAADGSIEARVEWTIDGLAAITLRRYRYLSPVFDYDNAGRIIRFSSFALTNKANLLLPALNREGGPVAFNPENQSMDLAALLKALGLPETATWEDALAAIASLQEKANSTAMNSQQADLNKFVPRADYNAATQRALNAEQKLKSFQDQQLDAAINAEIEAALTAGKITPATKDYHTACCRQEGGLERFRQFVGVAPSVTDPALPKDKVPEGGKTALNHEDREAMRALGMSESEYLTSLKKGDK